MSPSSMAEKDNSDPESNQGIPDGWMEEDVWNGSSGVEEGIVRVKNLARNSGGRL